MGIYDAFCEYISSNLFDVGSKGEYVSLVIDYAFINDACNKLSISEYALFSTVKDFMSNYPYNRIIKGSIKCLGVIAIQLYAASQRGSDKYNCQNKYKLLLSNILNKNIDWLNDWLSSYQEYFFCCFYSWCDDNDYLIDKTLGRPGPWRYVRYIITLANNTLNQIDLEHFGYDFWSHGLTPDEMITESDFWYAIGGKDELLKGYWHTQRSMKILNENNNEAIFHQIYTYYCKWDGSYIELDNKKVKGRGHECSYHLYFVSDFSRIEIRDENFNKVKEINVLSLCKSILKPYFREKYRGIIIFKPNEDYEGYWEEARYIDNSENGVAICSNNIYIPFEYNILAFYQNCKVISFTNNPATNKYFIIDKKPFKIEGGLKVGEHKYLSNGEPLLRTIKAVRFWLNGKPYKSEENSIYKLPLNEGKNILKFNGYNPISIIIVEPQNTNCNWDEYNMRWKVSLLKEKRSAYITPVKVYEDNRLNTFIGVDFSSFVSQFNNIPLVRRWVLAQNGHQTIKEDNFLIKAIINSK